MADEIALEVYQLQVWIRQIMGLIWRIRTTQSLRLPAGSDAKKAGGEDVSLQPDGGRAPGDG
jgi:hypothetical protein